MIENSDGKLIALPPIEICPKTTFFDFAAKYDPRFCEEIVPARISRAATKKAQAFAKRAHEKLNLQHLSRSDFIVMKNQTYILETNTLPGFTPNSLLPKEAAAAGINFGELCERLIRLPLRKKQK